MTPNSTPADPSGSATDAQPTMPVAPVTPSTALAPSAAGASVVPAAQRAADATDPGYDVTPRPVVVAGQPSRRGPVRAIAAALVAILAGSALFMAGFSLGRRDLSQPGTPAADEKAFEPFWNTYQTIIDRYAGGTVDKSKLIEGAIKGMISSLDDPYSAYLSAEDFQATLQGISGQFEGIGAEIATQDAKGASSDCATLGPDCRLVIISPIEGSPAQKAGMRPGDVVLTVDGTSLDGLTVDGARDRIRGKKGTQVTLTVSRTGVADPLALKITRDVIVQKEVITKDLGDGKVGYIALTGFSDNSANGLHDALVADLAKGDKKIILDLRGNPGGFVTAARAVASEFIGSGTVFWQVDSKGNKTATEAKAGGAATDPSIKLVVLIDKGSASASEIVAGALKDTHRATLVGETSFGKGTVQEWTPLEGAGGFRLTVAKWLTPDQTWIHHKGITPDVAVAMPPTPKPGEDPQLDKAVQLLANSAAGRALDKAA
jgi:carboxyl-terminal processing protease